MVYKICYLLTSSSCSLVVNMVYKIFYFWTFSSCSLISSRYWVLTFILLVFLFTDCSSNANFIKGGSLEKGNALEIIGMHLLLLPIFGQSIKVIKLRNCTVEHPDHFTLGHIEVSSIVIPLLLSKCEKILLRKGMIIMFFFCTTRITIIFKNLNTEACIFGCGN